MTNDETVLEVARAIRAYLPQLVGPDDAVVLDAELASLLELSGRGEPVNDRILAVLRTRDETHGWAADFLVNRRPRDVLDDRYSPLAGNVQPLVPPRYVCPHDDFSWYRRSVGQAVPRCPTHGLALELSTSRP